MTNPTKLFVLEGEVRESRMIDYMVKTFFKDKYNAKVITLPARMNLYMLYNEMTESDGFSLDFVEVIRELIPGANEELKDIRSEEIDEIYLIFDYDIHQTNLPEGVDPIAVVYEMLDFFNNETENGKLYISYPMIEAIYDYLDSSCTTYTGCYVSNDSFERYKQVVGNNALRSSRHLQYTEWESILKCFSQRLVCLMQPQSIDFKYYKSSISPKDIMDKQLELNRKYTSSFVLRALPELLFDYFKMDFWVAHFNTSEKTSLGCEKRKK